MARVKISYQCQACGYDSPKWLGKCPDCGTWNSFVEEKLQPRNLRAGSASKPVILDNVEIKEGFRYNTGISEYDRVLGGGIVPGSVVLVGGDPGIGKSTLLLQAMHGIGRGLGNLVLYVSAEESLEQIKIRSERLGISSDKIALLSETNFENVMSVASKKKPVAIVIDSIQARFTDSLSVPRLFSDYYACYQ